MDGLYISEIYIYPVKSLGGISLSQAQVQSTGLQYDRQWMLVNGQGVFLSQRTLAQMALLQVGLFNDALLVSHKKLSIQPLHIPFALNAQNKVAVSVWDDVCTAIEVSADANRWFSEVLGITARLVCMPATESRFVDKNYATENEIVGFADAFPFLMIGQSSLNDLNNRLLTPVSADRFRPNFVFTGGAPFCEDSFDTFRVGDITFKAVKPCARCAVTTVNQEDASKGQEPLKTLATYRTQNSKVMFGQNLLQVNFGRIKTGDKVEVKSWKQDKV